MIIDTLKKIGLDIVVIQETKKKIFYRKDVASIWGSKFKEWVFFFAFFGEVRRYGYGLEYKISRIVGLSYKGFFIIC